MLHPVRLHLKFLRYGVESFQVLHGCGRDSMIHGFPPLEQRQQDMGCHVPSADGCLAVGLVCNSGHSCPPLQNAFPVKVNDSDNQKQDEPRRQENVPYQKGKHCDPRTALKAVTKNSENMISFIMISQIYHFSTMQNIGIQYEVCVASQT